MGDLTPDNPPVPPRATQSVASMPQSEETNVSNLFLVSSEMKTLRRGNLLGIVRPYWYKVIESEQRYAWLKTMISKDLIVRDLNAYAKSIGEKLRSEEVKFREEERKILLDVMTLKLKDEKKHLGEVKREKERVRRKIIDNIGKTRQYDTLMKKLRKETMKRKTKLRFKYKKKVVHLENVRRLELEEKRLNRSIPKEIEMFKDCTVFNEVKLAQLAESKINGLTIGDVALDDDEISILKLNPKFAVMSRLIDEDIECEIELAVTKLRYELARKAELKSLDSAVCEKVDDKK